MSLKKRISFVSMVVAVLIAAVVLGQQAPPAGQAPAGGRGGGGRGAGGQGGRGGAAGAAAGAAAPAQGGGRGGAQAAAPVPSGVTIAGEIKNYVPITDAMLEKPDANDWLVLRHDQFASNYSPLSQITAANAGQLQLAWAMPM